MNSPTPGYFLILALLWGLAAPATALARDILFSAQIPADQAQTLTRDLKASLAFTADGTAMKKVMELNDLSDRALKTWLGERIGYFIGAREDSSHVLVALQKYQYQNPGIFPDLERPAPGTAPGAGGDEDPASPTNPPPPSQVFMTNAGTSFYYYGKSHGLLMGYKFDSPSGTSLTLPVASPRVGIVWIGAQLFQIVLNPQNPDSLANSLFRLGALFHEARHSDGNGKSLGFPHAVCPPDSDYANLNACDRNGNGPYTIGAEFYKVAAITCLHDGTCDQDEYERLALAAADSLSRVLSNAYWDPKPEGL